MKKLMCLGVLLTTLVLGTGALAQNDGIALKNVRFVFSGQGDTIYAEVVNERPFRMENLEVRAFLEVPQGPAHQSGSQQKWLSSFEHVCPFLKWNLRSSYTATLTGDIRSA